MGGTARERSIIVLVRLCGEWKAASIWSRSRNFGTQAGIGATLVRLSTPMGPVPENPGAFIIRDRRRPPKPVDRRYSGAPSTAREGSRFCAG